MLSEAFPDLLFPLCLFMLWLYIPGHIYYSYWFIYLSPLSDYEHLKTQSYI